MNYELQLAELQEKDYHYVKKIYDYYVENTTATFNTKPVPLSELKENIACGHAKYKSFLILYNNKTCGFCYLSHYNKRQAYDRTAEITLYLEPKSTSKGIGKLCLEKLKKLAPQLGIVVLVAIITAENTTSIKLFEKCGFEKCAHFKKVGEKFKRILDVVAYQLILNEE